MVVYFITYIVISMLYRLVLVDYADPKHRQNFELVSDTILAARSSFIDFGMPLLLNLPLFLQLFTILIFMHFLCFQFCIYCRKFDSPTTITFLTGFYVNKVVERWWAQFMSLPWPDQLALKLVAYMPGKVSMACF